MRAKQLHLLFVLLITLPLFTACEKDSEGEVVDPEPSRTDLLVAHEWQGDKVLMMGIDVTDNGAAPTDLPDVRTLHLTFNEDNTYIAKTEELNFEGTWQFNEDETKINLEDFFGFGEVEVERLTEDNLDLSTSVSKGQISILAQLLNLDLGPINNLPDGMTVEVDIRFVNPQ